MKWQILKKTKTIYKYHDILKLNLRKIKCNDDVVFAYRFSLFSAILLSDQLESTRNILVHVSIRKGI